MSDRLTGDAYIPLPKKLPTKEKDKSKGQGLGRGGLDTDSSREYDVIERVPKRDIRIVQVDSTDDEVVHPQIERTTPPSHSQSRRDSGKFMSDSRSESAAARLSDAIDAAEYERRRREADVDILTNRFNQALAQERGEREKIEAEKDMLKRRLEDEARIRRLKEREQGLRDREERVKQDEAREGRTIQPPPAPREVVIVNTRPVEPNSKPSSGDRGTNAHNRARDDYRRRTAGRGEDRDDRQRHPRERRRDITIVEDEEGRRPANRW